MDCFDIIIASSPDKKHLVAEIYYNDVHWAEISQEKEKTFIQFYPHPNHDYWELPFDETIKIINQAKNALLEI